MRIVIEGFKKENMPVLREGIREGRARVEFTGLITSCHTEEAEGKLIVVIDDLAVETSAISIRQKEKPRKKKRRK